MFRTYARRTCRACAGSDLEPVLDLGQQPPANAFLLPSELGQPESKYPLVVNLCRNCGMVQLADVVPAALLFREYLFSTSSSQDMVQHFQTLFQHAAAPLPGNALVVEVGSNDGWALEGIRTRNLRLLGIDPATNLAAAANARGIRTLPEFFTAAVAQQVREADGFAHLIVACNVLGHVDDLDDFCGGVRTLLHPLGRLIVEVPWLRDLLEFNEYDTIYHEHLSYFSLNALITLFARHGLILRDVEHVATHGGSLRITVVKAGLPEHSVDWYMDKERQQGQPAALQALAAAAAWNKQELLERLRVCQRRGLKVWGYAAPAKATVRLNYCEIGPDLLPCIVDTTPAKQGRHVPGTHQPILPVEALSEQPDYCLLLAWNHHEEILRREEAYQLAGGRFIMPWAGRPSTP